MKLQIYRSLLLLVVLTGCKSTQVVDLIIINGNIWTGNKINTEANAFAVSGDKIVEIGSNKEVLKWKGSKTEIINANGKFITPGFIDCHVHFLQGGLNLASVQLRDAKTPEEFAKRILEFSKKIDKDAWILGGEWDHTLWGGELPTKEWIDKLGVTNPVFVRRLDGHMALVNSAALKLAGIDKNTKAVTGGEIIKSALGEPTGLLKDNAMSLVEAIIPPPTAKDLEKALLASMNYVASHGVTSVHNVAGVNPIGYMEAFEKARDEGKLITRIYDMGLLQNWSELATKIKKEGKGNKWLKIGGLKGFVDGSLGSHTALFHDPYTDDHAAHGMYISTPDSIKKWVKNADKAGLQITVHAIGDEAIDFILNTFEETEKNNGDRDRRFRIEHAQHIAPNDIPRFAQLKVIASMQPYHAIDDGRWAEKVIGAERIKTTYAFKSMFDSGATVAFGSDWFVAPATPLEGIYAAVTRRTLDDKNPEGWVPEQKITVEQALTAYTINAAFASFDEKEKGSLEKGKLADFVIINEDLRAIAPEKIRDAKILQTFVGGKKVFDSSKK